MYCVPFIEITMSSIANSTIDMGLSSMKMPNLRNVSFMVILPPIENLKLQ